MALYVNRDAAISDVYIEQKRQGLVEDVYQLYGCAYGCSGKEAGYYITSREEKIFQFLLQCEQKGIPTAKVVQTTRRIILYPGQRSAIMRSHQWMLLAELKRLYPPQLFDAVAKLHTVERNGLARNTIEEWKQRLAGSYDINKLNLLEATAALLYQEGYLEQLDLYQLKEWLWKKRQQMDTSLEVRVGEPHVYAGFCWKDDTGCHYDMYTSHYKAYCARWALVAQRKTVSPILQQTRYFKAMDFHVVNEQRKQFQQMLKKELSEVYMLWLESLRMQCPAMQKHDYEAELEQFAENTNARETFCYYSSFINWI